VSRTPSSWIVLKFGGTSVSALENWKNIARVVTERRRSAGRILIVHSAITGITDRLERLLAAAMGQAPEEELRAIDERHRRLAAELGVTPGEEVERHLAELREIAAGVALVREVSDRTSARVSCASRGWRSPGWMRARSCARRSGVARCAAMY
jgi:bifunctional diaminopimelate decarboxylase / aspartate kinase